METTIKIPNEWKKVFLFFIFSPKRQHGKCHSSIACYFYSSKIIKPWVFCSNERPPLNCLSVFSSSNEMLMVMVMAWASIAMDCWVVLINSLHFIWLWREFEAWTDCSIPLHSPCHRIVLWPHWPLAGVAWIWSEAQPHTQRIKKHANNDLLFSGSSFCPLFCFSWQKPGSTCHQLLHQVRA